MSDVLVIGDPSDLLAAVDRSLAELGLQTRLVSPSQAQGVPERLPSMIVLIDDVERMAEKISHDDACSGLPLIVVADGERLATGAYAALGHELVVHPFSVGELQTRLARARFAAHGPAAGDVLRCGSLEVNTATYQVTISGQAVDFTFMEYELLKFLVTNPNRVFSREALLNNVWGYDYYGGARTVDVHVRRLRAKLGHEHAERIRTLRSVGYRFDAT